MMFDVIYDSYFDFVSRSVEVNIKNATASDYRARCGACGKWSITNDITNVQFQHGNISAYTI